mmetsp:Transcript_44126/g.140459  ORF Transcript_44126/g.140459 Transcript_44126/m.140459 type:complete len:124 (-) Transcript_44126:71-442(-)|eukprot:CAMPEP_0182912344 /NCGR_PEP_ID=MMETSP0034_2-20130328/37466_1 /TAXON_ID=156128 /ORGANISM="Nephroselmis pyriformis, Strain CCMP717" /LENGTH=123 /DNA_ID=CAMNT_0025049011 /DNA_START=72 /DNA_END=443 /DNA_ORIENTATION=-
MARMPPIPNVNLNNMHPFLNQALNADTAANSKKIYHMSSYALAGLAPVAALRPNLPTDLLLNAVIPVHSHIAMNYIIADYVPKAMMGPARMGMLGVTGITALGMLKLNIFNGGVSYQIKKLWG